MLIHIAVSSASKYFYHQAGFFGLTVPIPENILNLDEGDKIRLTITLPSSVGSLVMDGFFEKNEQVGGQPQGNNISIVTFIGGSGEGNKVQNFSRSISIQKL